MPNGNAENQTRVGIFKVSYFSILKYDCETVFPYLTDFFFVDCQLNVWEWKSCGYCTATGVERTPHNLWVAGSNPVRWKSKIVLYWFTNTGHCCRVSPSLGKSMRLQTGMKSHSEQHCHNLQLLKWIQIVTCILLGHFLPGQVNRDNRWTRSMCRPDSPTVISSKQNGQVRKTSPGFFREMESDNSSTSNTSLAFETSSLEVSSTMSSFWMALNCNKLI